MIHLATYPGSQNDRPLPLPLDEQHLSSLPQAKRFNLRGLIDCSTGHLSERQSKVGGDISSLVCLSISFLGRGDFNYVYRLEFSDGTQLAASVSSASEQDYSPAAKESEIATMRFVRESGLYPDVSVPQVYAWNTIFESPAGVPYVLMDFIKGTAFNLAVRDDDSDPGWYRGLRAVPESQQVALVKAMARLKASLSKPVPFTEIGSLVVDSSGTFSVGPLMAVDGESLGGPYKSVEDMWRESHEECLLGGIEECCDRTEESFTPFERFTPHDFMDRYQKLSALIPHFKIPEPYTPLVLHHPDLALRNIFFDEESLLSDDPKVACVIDWSGAQILPLMLASCFPLDMVSTPSNPLEGPAERTWYSVPYDSTYFRDTDKTMVQERDSLREAKRYRCEIRLFYLRGLFGAHYGQQIVKLHQDSDLPRATVYLDAQYYLKFHEVMMGSFHEWIVHRRWISETYWRLRMMPTGKSASGERLVIGPNVYRSTKEPAVVDLGLLEDTPEETLSDQPLKCSRDLTVIQRR
ncbi:hypothetical protein D9611_000885 [Ephemerocybe angulata]|uniref:Aminoglycoside phosphotransferase domain-containing protein n=1 Tax=Ephemerocybe angulata TaxID=980116 RepID=A0A8H5F758_9AGAR|nr:hypothetical protein D9611_000885 [Tulosesus angulatus]